jgi:hypothetical protein
MTEHVILARPEQIVILSAAKDHLAGIERRKMILRFAQDDKSFRSFQLQVH